MSNEDNGNVCAGTAGVAGVGTTATMGSVGGLLKPHAGSSTEDLSEYTDADESISAPTEFLAEFLSAVMLKDYETALKYCKLILQYEPNNVTAKDFYPLILEKLQNTYNTKSSKHRNPSPSSSSSSGSLSSATSSSDSSTSESDSDDDGDEADAGAEVDAEEDDEEEPSGEGKRCSSDGEATTASYSSLEDEEAEQDQLNNVAARYKVDNVDFGNGNKIICDNQGASWDVKGTTSHGPTTVPFGTSSDSESPTEPVSQQTIAMLRARVVPPRH